MGFDQAAKASGVQIIAMDGLGDGAFNPGSVSIDFFESRGSLTFPGGLEGLVIGLGPPSDFPRS